MIERVSGCKGCGLRPCFDCMEVVYTCDCCSKEVDELYVFENDQLCDKCYIKESFSSFVISKKAECINCYEVGKTYSFTGDDDKYCKECMIQFLKDNREIASE